MCVCVWVCVHSDGLGGEHYNYIILLPAALQLYVSIFSDFVCLVCCFCYKQRMKKNYFPFVGGNNDVRVVRSLCALNACVLVSFYSIYPGTAWKFPNLIASQELDCAACLAACVRVGPCLPCLCVGWESMRVLFGFVAVVCTSQVHLFRCNFHYDRQWTWTWTMTKSLRSNTWDYDEIQFGNHWQFCSSIHNFPAGRLPHQHIHWPNSDLEITDNCIEIAIAIEISLSIGNSCNIWIWFRNFDKNKKKIGFF